MFWITIVLMTTVTLIIVLLPLLRMSQFNLENRDILNVQIAKDQLNKLKQDRQEGHLSDADYELAVTDVEKSLHSDLANKKEVNNYTMERAYKSSAALLFLIPITVVVLYYYLGNPAALTMKTALPEVQNRSSQLSTESVEQNKVSDVRSMFEALQQRLESNPNDGQGWMMMGLSYMHFEQFDDAVDAYQKAVALMPDDSQALAGLERAKNAQLSGADSQQPDDTIDKKMTAPNGQVVDVGAMVMRLRNKLELNPNNLQGWLMLGRSYTNLGLHEDAVFAYQNALELQPEDEQIHRALADAKQAATQ